MDCVWVDGHNVRLLAPTLPAERCAVLLGRAAAATGDARAEAEAVLQLLASVMGDMGGCVGGG
jgi:hypothetical protein